MIRSYVRGFEFALLSALFRFPRHSNFMSKLKYISVTIFYSKLPHAIFEIFNLIIHFRLVAKVFVPTIGAIHGKIERSGEAWAMVNRVPHRPCKHDFDAVAAYPTPSPSFLILALLKSQYLFIVIYRFG